MKKMKRVKIMWHAFNELSLIQLYQILQLRQRVFIEEQQSIYTDIDDLDQQAQHLCVWKDDELIGYMRVLQQSTKIKLQRVVVSQGWRGEGLGQAMMEVALKYIDAQRQVECINLSSQLSVCEFYRRFGFQCEGDSYDDGGIEHIDMRKALGGENIPTK